jgi:hypothetical protein
MMVRLRTLIGVTICVCSGCEETPRLDEPVFHTPADPSQEELPPGKEVDDDKTPVGSIPKKEGQAKLSALLQRLEEASEQTTQAEDELPLFFGAVTDAKGNRYVGQFKNGKRHGYGTYHFVTGDRFEGEYRNGLREGYGTYQFKKGDRYVGYFHKGKYHRWGAYFFTNGDKFFGEYENGLRNGKGTHARINGERYEGEFLAGKRHGLGRCTFSNGERYAGAWKNGEPDGWGSFHYANHPKSPKDILFKTQLNTAAASPPSPPPATRENLIAGDRFLVEALQLNSRAKALGHSAPTDADHGPLPTFAPTLPTTADEPLSPALRELPGGDRYVGQLRDGQPHGQGAYLFSGGERYVGDFLHGLHHGQGLLVLDDGRRYLGEWANGLRHGYGVLYDQEGQVVREGEWRKDEPMAP